MYDYNDRNHQDSSPPQYEAPAFTETDQVVIATQFHA